MKRSVQFFTTVLLSAMCILPSAIDTQAKQGAAVVQFYNNSGRELVIAMVQGATAGQTVNQVKWLQFGTGSASWVVPPTPTSNADLLPYIQTVGIGDSIVVSVPEYNDTVGFRCLVSDPAFKQNAMQYLVTSTASIAYMAFPNMETVTYVFDKFEAGLTVNTPGIWNITAVDFVALPMQLSSKGVKVGFKDGVTAKGLDSLLGKLPAPYSLGGITTPNTADTTYRFFAPANIDSVYTALDSQIIVGLPLLVTYTGTIAYGNYTFSSFSNAAITTTATGVVGAITCNYNNTAVGVSIPTSITVNDITTQNGFAGTIVGSSNANVNNYKAQGELGAILSAALCRGVTGYPNKWGDIVYTGTNCPTPWNYYPLGQQYDAYSKLIHSYSIDGKNYGFPYDDYFADEAGFTAIAGDTISVHVLPYTGTFSAQPNAPMRVRTGCLVATVPASTIYPNGAAWKIGSVKVETNLLAAGSNQLCFLNSDTVICTFPSFPQYQMRLSMSCRDSANAITYYKNGKPTTELSISGVSYNSCTRILSFGTSAAWLVQDTNCLTITLPSTYPSGAGWQIGTIKVKGIKVGDSTLTTGANKLCFRSSDSIVVCTFPSDTAYAVHINLKNQGNNSAITYYKHGKQDTTLSISNMSYQSSARTLSFGPSAAWITPNCLVFNLPSTYSTGATWQIGPIVVGSDTIAIGNPPLCFPSSDTVVVCTFPNFPNYQMRVSMKQGKRAVAFYTKGPRKRWIKKSGMNIVGFSPQPSMPPYGWFGLNFGPSASWTGVGN